MGFYPLTVVSGISAADTGQVPTAEIPRYLLRSNSKSHLLLHSPLRSLHRPCHINLAPKTSTSASTTMSGTPLDPAAMDAKIDRILGQLNTINNRLNPTTLGSRAWRRASPTLARAAAGMATTVVRTTPALAGMTTVVAARTMMGVTSIGIAPRRSSATAPSVIGTAS